MVPAIDRIKLRRAVMRIAMAVLRITVMLVLGLTAYLRIFENRLIFYPERTLAASPSVPYENLDFTALDGTRLHGWFIPFEKSRRVFVISHGNAGNIGDRYEMGEYVNQEFEANVLMYDYRGYGRSEGEPSESGLYSDLRGALRYVHSRGYAPDEVYLIGQSLGAAVTVDVAAQEPVAGVILEAPPTSAGAVARWHMFSIPVDLVMRARFDSLSKIHNVRAPIAIVHAKADPVVPFAFGQQLFDAAAAPKKLFAIDAELHEGAIFALGYARTQELRRFLFGDENRLRR